ncbi:MAG: hypothetical protein N7Q72_02010 [Spiroplasma sp. Tabriz.8]|nr:hypothetical protein [Candidatus Regiella insecticola]MCZ8632018.1 hypothetical protein [Spiroplasma sp. Tabriz.8]
MYHIRPKIFKHANNLKFYLFIIVIIIIIIIIMCNINFFIIYYVTY